MNDDLHEQLMERDLAELLGGETTPDLIERTLARIKSEEADNTASARPGRQVKDVAPVVARIHWLSRLATAACVLVAVGLMVWVLWPQGLPVTVTPDATATYRVKADHIELSSGWLLVSDGAPQVRVGADRLSKVNGRAVVGAGIPGGGAVGALANEFELDNTEREMLKSKQRWLTAGSLALCLFTGSATLNDDVVNAQDLPSVEINIERAEVPEPDDVEGVRKFFENVSEVDVRALKNWNWGGWLTVEGEDAEAIATAFRDEISERPEGQADWDHENQLRLRLEDGRMIEASVYNHGELVNVKLPGWERGEDYVCNARLRKTLKPWLTKAAEVPRYPVEDADRLRRTLKRATRVKFQIGQGEGAIGGVILDAETIRELLPLMLPSKLSTRTSTLEETAITTTWTLDDGEVYSVSLGGSGGLFAGVDNVNLFERARVSESERKAVRDFLKEIGTSAFGARLEWTGADSEITTQRVEFITDTERWNQVWWDHKTGGVIDGEFPTPEVDFEKKVVLAVFAGAGFNSKGYYVDSILQAQTGYVVRVDEHTFQTAGEAVPANPYGIFVLPKIERTIVVEENVQNLLGKPPLWKQLEASMSAAGELPPMLDEYLPGSQRSEPGSHDAAARETHVISDAEEWEKIIDRIDAGGEWDTPDFDKEIAIIALGFAPPRVGSFLLDVYALSAGNLHVRLIAPYAQAEKRAEPVKIFGVWVLRKPTNGVVIETPQPTMNEPSKWLEEKAVEWKD